MRQVDHTVVCAHRGASGTHPENTLAAFREAMRLGVEMIEFDVGQTRDGHSVLLHDDAVDRTTNGSGELGTLTLDQIKELDAGSWRGARFSGERVATLAEALALIPPTIELNVHIKPYASDLDGLVADVIAQLRRHRSPEDAFIASHHHVIQRISALAPEWPTCSLTGSGESGYIDATLGLGCLIVQPRHVNVTPRSVQRAHELGMRINVFFADTQEEMGRLLDLGVDGILTNYPARLQALLGQRRAM